MSDWNIGKDIQVENYKNAWQKRVKYEYLKGLQHEIFVSFFYESTPNRVLMNVMKQFNIFSRIRGANPSTKFDFPRIIRGKSELPVDYAVERHAIPGYDSRKVKTFRGFFCIKAGFSTVKSTESFYFSRPILRKDAFPQDIPWKVKIFRELSCRKFRYSMESQNLTLKRPSTTFTDKFRQEVNHG